VYGVSVSCSVYCVSCTQVGGGREGTGAENEGNEGGSLSRLIVYESLRMPTQVCPK